MAWIRSHRASSGTGRAFEKAFEAALAIGVGVVLGYYVDRWLDTGPMFLFLFMLAGLVACVRTLLQIQAGGVADRAASEKSERGEPPE